MLEKRNSIPMQNTHDLLVGTLSIGIPSLFSLVSVVHRENELSPTNQVRRLNQLSNWHHFGRPT